MSARPAIRDRYSFANLDEALELPDLIAIQRESFEWFLKEGLAETFRDISPIKDFTETLQLELEFDPDASSPQAALSPRNDEESNRLSILPISKSG